MTENPFKPQQNARLKASLLVGMVLLSIGIFLFSYFRWESVLLSLAITFSSAVLFFVLLRNVVLARVNTPRGRRRSHK